MSVVLYYGAADISLAKGEAAIVDRNHLATENIEIILLQLVGQSLQ